jgi:CspA family cold shock protein
MSSTEPSVVTKSHTFKGQVKWFDYKKGFGFIQKNVEKNTEPVEIFVHFTNIDTENEFKMLYPGEHVMFEEMECSGKGVQAKCVRAPSNGKLMHEFKFENNLMPQKRNGYTQPWDNNTMYIKNLSDELSKCLNKGGKGKGKGKSKGKGKGDM